MQSVSWRPIVGCSPASIGCSNCSALGQAGAGVTRDGPNGPLWTGRTRLVEQSLIEPVMLAGRAMIHVCDHGDLFHEATPDAWIDRVFEVMEALPRHRFAILTKRARRMSSYLSRRHRRGAPDHLWFGVSAERQRELEARMTWFSVTPAAVRYLTIYPLLGPIDLRAHLAGISLVHAGDEPQRPAQAEWYAALERQCSAAGVPFARGQLLDAA